MSLDMIERLVEQPQPMSNEPPAKLELHQLAERVERMTDEMPPRMAMALIMQRVSGVRRLRDVSQPSD
jgi:DNA-directed RNA polymerase specialized sigma24 family protein